MDAVGRRMGAMKISFCFPLRRKRRNIGERSSLMTSSTHQNDEFRKKKKGFSHERNIESFSSQDAL